MPVFLDAARDRSITSAERSIRIGLVNNMGDEALKTTERQFVTLLQAASEGMQVHLSLYSLPCIARTPTLARHIDSHYADMGALWQGQLDGLIVTGREPLASRLDQEPYWPEFQRLVEWSRENTHSTVWSCLAAHAAILHLDGVERVKRKEKLFGILTGEQATQHPLLAATPRTVRVPHSRWNGIPEESLLDSGYQVLTRCGKFGVDSFIKQEKSLFVFFQGHPEYATNTLAREYRRDVGRFMRGESDGYPSLPQHYFPPSTAGVLAAVEARAMIDRDAKLLTEVTQELDHCLIQNHWLLSATALYRNWLHSLCARKEEVSRPLRTGFVANLEAVS